MKKYVFNPYSKIFPELFNSEKKRIFSRINNALAIEHVGSTAIPGLGGKGIIDIAIAVDKQDMDSVTEQLQSLGYEFRPAYSTPDRSYFVIYLPDPEEENRRYHIHLTFPKSQDWKELIGFRDYLKNHPQEVQTYSELKKEAAHLADQDGETYRKIKEPFFKKINLLRENSIPVMVKMHADELDIDASLVQRLLAKQFPCWADLPLKPLSSAGTDNALYRLGNDMVVRLPRIGWAAKNVDKECQWLPQIAPFLPIPIPVPLGKGTPSGGYPWVWSVYRWIEGKNPTVNHIPNPSLLVNELVTFIQAMHKIDLQGGPTSSRGVSLKEQDIETRKAIQELDGMIDVDAVTRIWEAALKIPIWSKPPVWVHGDLSPGNILIEHDKLCAVIDFGILGIGDPACDLIIAWNLLPAHVREAFRTGLNVDDATWQRGRAWALSNALIALPYYKNTNPVLADNARHVIKEVIEDDRQSFGR
jgi:aminoglycoside phosphotransferase (APT) family kinase protein/GrpB-like predicted nucleotidyltransferase (UPF0157 family)